MTRIIGGFAGSLRLEVPPAGTRPTSDRVREAIFSALEARDAVAGARVLDLFAGSGALGLEAASRGAASVDLVDRSGPASAVAARNAGVVRRAAPRGAGPAVTTSTRAARAFLDGGGDRAWDLVLIDPPYDLGNAELEDVLGALVPRLAPGAVVVLERSARADAPGWPAGLVLERRKDYGETAVYWLAAG